MVNHTARRSRPALLRLDVVVAGNLLVLLLVSASLALASNSSAGTTEDGAATPTDDSRRDGGAEAGLTEAPKLAVTVATEATTTAGAAATAAPAPALSGVAIMDAVNAAAEKIAAMSSSPMKKEQVVSTCQTGFVNLAAIERAACPAGGENQTVVWDAYDEAYSAAPVALPNEYLTMPTGGNCLFGCIPVRKTTSASSALEGIAMNFPWPIKCFTAAAPGEMVAGPTLPDGNLSSTPVPLLGRVNDMIEEGGPGYPPEGTQVSEQRRAPDVVYEGVSTFDGEKAIIIDNEAERAEVRYIGCGVWLGKSYLTGSLSSLADSIASKSGIKPGPLLDAIITSGMPPPVPPATVPLLLSVVLFGIAPPEA